MKCSIASGSISSQKPAFFSLTLQSRSMIHRHTEIWKWQGSASASPLIQEICCYLSKWASALLELQWLVQSLREPLVWSHHLKQLLQGTWSLLQVPNFCPFTFISLWMPLALFVISLVFSALISILYLVQVLSRLSTRVSSFCTSSARASMSSANRRLVISAAYANLPIMFFQGIRHDPFEKNVEEGGWQKTALPYSDCCSEPFSYAAIHLDCTCSHVIELLNGAN